MSASGRRLLFCGSGWLPIVDAIRARLPTGDTIAIWDRAIPLVQAVGEIDVMLPSNAAITADVIADPRVVALPHVAGSTEEAFARIVDVVIDNLGRLERGEPLLHRVT